MNCLLNYKHKSHSSHERLRLIKLDDCSILQRVHLVRSRPSPECMIRSALKTSISHGSDYSGVRLMGRVTSEYLARLDLRENSNTLSDSVTPIPHLGQGLQMSSRASLGSTPHGYDTKTWPHSGKILA
jgi:hypothetical protein